MITSESSSFQVREVWLRNGIVHHVGNFVNGVIKPGSKVRLVVDKERRLLHNRIDSAGELICVAMRNLGYKDWKVVGAIHYPERSSVEYGGIIPVEHNEDFRQNLEHEVNQLIRKGEDVRIQIVNDREQVKTLCGFIPDYIPESQPIRVVTVSGEIGRPCQGTHVKNINEIGVVIIRKVRSRKGKTAISYTLA